MTYFDFGDGNGLVLAHQHPNGEGWVANTTTVAGNVYIGPDARVFGNARVSDNAIVYGDAEVSGKARVSGYDLVSGYAVPEKTFTEKEYNEAISMNGDFKRAKVELKRFYSAMEVWEKRLNYIKKGHMDI